jgi:hypothetical protein
VYIEDETSINNNSSSGSGGGIANLIVPLPTGDLSPFTVSPSSPGTVYLDSNSQVNGNTSVLGGGIDNGAFFTVNNGQVSRNTATSDGGGISNESSLTVVNGVVTKNLAHVTGGGIYENGGTASVTTSTIKRNTPNNCFPLGSIAGCIG